MGNDPYQWPSMVLNPVGIVNNAIEPPVERSDRTDTPAGDEKKAYRERLRRLKNGISKLTIFAQWEELLDGIEDFSHILVLYWPHLIDPERRSLKKVHPMGREDLPEKGIFSTCSPARPNPVLVSAVALVERKGRVLTVRGLEAFNGSPIVDIKPYSSYFLHTENLKIPEWMAEINRDREVE